jgi:hypothetical protein
MADIVDGIDTESRSFASHIMAWLLLVYPCGLGDIDASSLAQ